MLQIHEPHFLLDTGTCTAVPGSTLVQPVLEFWKRTYSTNGGQVNKTLLYICKQFKNLL